MLSELDHLNELVVGANFDVVIILADFFWTRVLFCKLLHDCFDVGKLLTRRRRLLLTSVRGALSCPISALRTYPHIRSTCANHAEDEGYHANVRARLCCRDSIFVLTRILLLIF